jgi:hypothetical protein
MYTDQYTSDLNNSNTKTLNYYEYVQTSLLGC